ncbi:MAG: hypothetical protein LBE62_06615 [Azonexus sp.]|jgi:hypothetical protein|nr:hypothetical protein [Azonexus sp.]
MESRITVVGSELKSAIYSGKNGAPPREVKRHVCKVILHIDGVVDVGTLNVPVTIVPETDLIQPGDYMISYRAGRGFQEDKIVGVMTEFRPVKPAKADAKPEPKSA